MQTEKNQSLHGTTVASVTLSDGSITSTSQSRGRMVASGGQTVKVGSWSTPSVVLVASVLAAEGDGVASLLVLLCPPVDVGRLLPAVSEAALSAAVGVGGMIKVGSVLLAC